MGEKRETLGFQAEVRQLLQLMIHSLYSHREIFLRELVSNASDANDKLRFEALSRPALLADEPALAIWVEADAAAGTLSVRDNGIGMTRDEAVAHLGTIAKSGTAEFFGRLTGEAQRDAQLIGQFGVGFYSAFIVADRVVVESRRAGAAPGEAIRWESAADGEFSIETIERAQRGTTVTLHLKDDAREFLDPWRLRALVRRYSDHIAFPVRMRKDAEEGAPDAAPGHEDVNQAQALWARAKAEVSDDEYRAFYRHVSHDGSDPLAWSHNRVEGRREYTSLLYLPARAPFDLWQREAPRGLKLYVRRVFIMDNAEQFLPLYLRFVRGVVDSADLPLNVSRELLQQDAEVEAMRGALARRALELIAKLAADDAAKYATFWKEFGRVLKEGLAEDPANRERLLPLLRFASTHAESDEEGVSLADYVKRMKEGQEAIYVVTADSLAGAKGSPQLEIFRKKGIEVLLLVDRVDEWLLAHLFEFDGKPLQSVAKGAVDLGKLQDEDEKKRSEEAAETFKPVLERLKEALKDRAKDVRVTTRLVDSPACLVVDEGDISGHLARMLKQAGQEAPKAMPILEVNAEHALVKRLESSAHFDDLAHILFDQAMLAEGGTLEDPAAYVKRVNALLAG